MKPDKSPQGFYDEDIVPLLNILNKKYETTSSCSGRITLMVGDKKSNADWVYKTHLHAEVQEIYNLVQKHGNLRFFFEPFIVHVKCFTKENAEVLLNLLHANGLKKSGLKSFNDYLIEINLPGRMETILTKDLSKEYIQLLVDEANKRLRKTKEMITKLERTLNISD